MNERYTNAIAMLMALANKLEVAILNGSQLDRTTALDDYRKEMRAARNEYNDFLFDHIHKASQGYKSEQQLLDALTQREYVTYYKQPKGKNAINDNECTTYANSISDLQHKLNYQHSFLLRLTQWNGLNDGTPPPAYTPGNYLNAWSTNVDNGIVYAYGELNNGELVDNQSMQLLDGTTISHYKVAFVDKQIVEERKQGYTHCLPYLYPLADLAQEADFANALDELKQYVPRDLSDEEQALLATTLLNVLSRIESLHSQHDENTESLTTVLENTARLLNLAAHATPEERQIACANYQEKARLLEGAPSLELQILGGILFSLGAVILTLTLITSPPLIAAGAASLCFMGLGGTFFHQGRHTDLSADASNLAELLMTFS